MNVTSAVASEVATHSFYFNMPSTVKIVTIVFENCSNSPLIYFACNVPAGMDANSAVLSSQTGNVGFSIDSADTTANKIVLTRPSAPGVAIPNTYIFDNITNPSTPGENEYIRIASYASTDGSGPRVDLGATAYSIVSKFEIGAYVPPFLKFCVGVTVAPDCSSQTGDSLDLGILTSNAARAGQTQFSTATNDPNGYVIFALGTTMTSGNNTIPSIGSLAASFPGNGQFGINLRANLIPAVGQDPIGIGTGTPTANYNVPNRFYYNSGDSITLSSLPSDYNRMTVSYIANIPSNQPVGLYSTTLTYVATVQF
jgi:hypothetical protein